MTPQPPSPRRASPGACLALLVPLGSLVLAAGCATAPAPRTATAPEMSTETRTEAAPNGEAAPHGLKLAERLLETGDAAGAVRAYEGYLETSPAGPESDHALFRLALLYLRPQGSTEEWRRARGLLGRLVAEFPGSPWRPAAESVLHLQDEIERMYLQLQAIKRIDLEPEGPEEEPRL